MKGDKAKCRKIHENTARGDGIKTQTVYTGRKVNARYAGSYSDVKTWGRRAIAQRAQQR